MLSSITPLGHRGREGKWRRTVAAFWVGAIATSIAVFSLVGVLGMVSGVPSAPLWVVGLVLLAGMVLEVSGWRAPGTRRQVNEDWLGRYRDWVVGLGFGAQLGTGLATIVPTFAVWTLYLIALLEGIRVALLVGFGFAVGRSLPLLTTSRIHRPSDLVDLMTRVTSLETPARRVLVAGYSVLLLIVSLHVF